MLPITFTRGLAISLHDVSRLMVPNVVIRFAFAHETKDNPWRRNKLANSPFGIRIIWNASAHRHFLNGLKQLALGPEESLDSD